MLLDQIQQDLKTAMLAKEETSVSALRMLISAIRYTGNGRDQQFPDDEVIAVIQKEIKKRKESIEAFQKAGREESVQKEEAELKVVEKYLPSQLSDEELTKIVEGTINEVGATSIQDMGKVIGMVMGKVGTGADGGRVSSLVREKLLS